MNRRFRPFPDGPVKRKGQGRAITFTLQRIRMNRAAAAADRSSSIARASTPPSASAFSSDPRMHEVRSSAASRARTNVPPNSRPAHPRRRRRVAWSGSRGLRPVAVRPVRCVAATASRPLLVLYGNGRSTSRQSSRFAALQQSVAGRQGVDVKENARARELLAHVKKNRWKPETLIHTHTHPV